MNDVEFHLDGVPASPVLDQSHHPRLHGLVASKNSKDVYKNCVQLASGVLPGPHELGLRVKNHEVYVLFTHLIFY